MFAPLHTKSDYSPGYGTASVEDLVRRAAEFGYPALALTDLENLYGQVRFHFAARQWGLKAITGVELRSGYQRATLGRKEGRLILLARDQAGYESLCRIITHRRSAPGPQDDDPLRCLEEEPRGLFYLSDDAAALGRLIRAGVPPADVRFLLIRPGGQPAPTDLRAVADTDVVMADPADRDLHVLQVAIRRRQKVSAVTDAEPPERSLPSRKSLGRLFLDAPEALAESLSIAEACSFDLTTARRPVLPTPACNGGETPENRLNRICLQRLEVGRREGKWHGAAYNHRLHKELAIIQGLDFAAYFLIVMEITDRARQQGIAVAGRGSALGSLVAHVLGITAVDPIVHGLYFERFLHSRRIELPDIDLDLPSDRRDEVIDWVFQRFGAEKAAMVSAHQTFGRRNAFREGLKALGMNLADVDRFCEQLTADDIEGAPSPFPVHLLSDRYRSAVPTIMRLVGKLQHISVHPGGIVLAEPRIDRYAPLERAPKGVLVTQYDMHSLQKIGLVKIDLLGNRALSAVQETLRWIGHPVEIPDGDAATLEALREARTVGCFQIETPAMRAVLRRLPVRGLEDLVAALAIVRPGPASGEAKAAFIRRAHGEEPARPPHPRLAEALRETYGMMLYEEDFMMAISSLTGWPLEKADEMRAALLTAQDDAAAMVRLERHFLDASAATGVSEEEAAAVWTVLKRFVAYSFNKAHVTGYAHLAWQTIYLKTHFPAPFACGVLNTYGGLYPLRTVAADFTRHGVRLLAPHVNLSANPCTIESNAVRIGLSAVKHLTNKNRKEILKRRPFQDFRDFLNRTPLSFRECQALVLCGACDDLTPLTPAAYPIAHEELLARLKEERSAQALDGFVARYPHGPRRDLYSALVRIRNELIYLDMHLPDHPIRLLREEAQRAGCITTAELAEYKGKMARIAGLVAATRRLATRGGQIMQFVTFEDEKGLVEGVILPDAYAALGDPVTNPGPFLVSGRVAEDHDAIHLLVSEITPFHRRERPYART
ncbi:MAG: DNA polymerase III subunit alpha [Gemmataceae bacterium]